MILEAGPWNLVDSSEYFIVVLPETAEVGAYTVKKMDASNCPVRIVARGPAVITENNRARSIDGQKECVIFAQWQSVTFHQDPKTKNWVIV